MSVMIVGGNGFIGAHLAAAIGAAGESVVIVSRSGFNPKTAWITRSTGARLVERRGDGTDPEFLEAQCRRHDVRAIVAAAGILTGGDSFLSWRVNALGPAASCEAARRGGASRVVLVSTNALYAAKRHEPIREDHPTVGPLEGNAFRHYGTTKLAGELAAMSYARAEGVDAVALRVSGVYGLAMSGPLYIRETIENALAGKPTHFSTGGDMPRDYTYVGDVIAGLVAALDPARRFDEQRVFNVATGHVHRPRDIPPLIRKLIPGADVTIGPGMSDAESEDAKTRGALDNSAAAKWLGYAPRYDLEAGLAAMVAMSRDFMRSQP
jgi:nucleoside-diphosphate-sugar epimerase